jgi:hypothetical protein
MQIVSPRRLLRVKETQTPLLTKLLPAKLLPAKLLPAKLRSPFQMKPRRKKALPLNLQPRRKAAKTNRPRGFLDA